jgi:hypothetical protein
MSKRKCRNTKSYFSVEDIQILLDIEKNPGLRKLFLTRKKKNGWRAHIVKQTLFEIENYQKYWRDKNRMGEKLKRKKAVIILQSIWRGYKVRS